VPQLAGRRRPGPQRRHPRPPRRGGENEAVIPLSKLERMLGHGGGMRTLTAAVEKLADRPVQIDVDSQTIARAVQLGQRKLARR
jgi:hypothetical protein